MRNQRLLPGKSQRRTRIKSVTRSSHHVMKMIFRRGARSNSVMDVKTFFDNLLFSDITVQSASRTIERDGTSVTIEGKRYPAHRVVLASASPYLSALIDSFRESKECPTLVLPIHDTALDIALRAMYGCHYRRPRTPSCKHDLDFDDEGCDCDTVDVRCRELCAVFEEVATLGSTDISTALWSKIIDCVWSSWSSLDTHISIFGLAVKYKLSRPAFHINDNRDMVKFLAQLGTLEGIVHILKLTDGDIAWKVLIYWAALHPTIDVSSLVPSMIDPLPTITPETTPALEAYVDVPNLGCFFAVLGKRQFARSSKPPPKSAKIIRASPPRPLINYERLQEMTNGDPTPGPKKVDEKDEVEHDKVQEDGIEDVTRCTYYNCVRPRKIGCTGCARHQCPRCKRRVVSYDCTMCYDCIDFGVDDKTIECRLCELKAIAGTRACSSRHMCTVDLCLAARFNNSGLCEMHEYKRNPDNED